jgi:hypothetical protein
MFQTTRQHECVRQRVLARIPAFLASPPLGFRGGHMDLYRYVGNDPTNATDPTGLKPSESVADELRSGAFAKNQDNKLSVPISIELTKKGATPAIRQTMRKPQQEDEGPDAVNVNPWFGRGGEDAKVGDVFNPAGSGGFLNIEWVITFRGNPYNGKWGRNIVTWDDSFLQGDGKVHISYYTGDRDKIIRDDTDNENTYISGNKVYMYSHSAPTLKHT